MQFSKLYWFADLSCHRAGNMKINAFLLPTLCASHFCVDLWCSFHSCTFAGSKRTNSRCIPNPLLKSIYTLAKLSASFSTTYFYLWWIGDPANSFIQFSCQKTVALFISVFFQVVYNRGDPAKRKWPFCLGHPGPASSSLTFWWCREEQLVILLCEQMTGNLGLFFREMMIEWWVLGDDSSEKKSISLFFSFHSRTRSKVVQ